MEFRAPHGCYDLEKVVGNRYNVDLRMEVEIGDAPVSDELLKSVNYLAVYEQVAEEIQVPSNILENVAWRILERIHGAFPQIVSSTVKVSKLAPPLGGKVERVSVTLSK
jgi:dihydroneopterin aldolase